MDKQIDIDGNEVPVKTGATRAPSEWVVEQRFDGVQVGTETEDVFVKVHRGKFASRRAALQDAIAKVPALQVAFTAGQEISIRALPAKDADDVRSPRRKVQENINW